MSVQVRRRREAASFLASFVGAQGELIVDTTNNRVQVHDGATPGGFAAAKLAEVVTNARTAVVDASYTALASDRTIAFTTVTAARILTLPAASTYPTGTQLLVVDESGNCSATNTITIARAGTDTINGATSASIATAFGYLAFESNGAGKWTIVDQTPTAGGGTAAVTRGSISGLILTNDTTTPNSVLDISAGSAADSTGAVAITLAAFTKSTGGPWTAGTGANGMGNGLTIAASTWYHVFAIVKGGGADVYLDTSIAAANAPSGTTAVRRLGSIRTDSSSRILPFTQIGDEFIWKTGVTDISNVTPPASPTNVTLTVPPNVNVIARFNVNYGGVSGGVSGTFYCPYTTSNTGQNIGTNNASAAINQYSVMTNTASQIAVVFSSASGAYTLVTVGWSDTRGK